MTGASSSSNPSQVQPPPVAISPETREEAAGFVRTSLPSISFLRPPIPTSDVWFLTYFSCSSCLLGRIGSILSVDHAIVSNLIVRSRPNFQDKCPIPRRTQRNFRIGIWRLSGVETGPIRGVGCTGVLGDVVIVWYGRTWHRLSGVLTGLICGVGCTGVFGDYVKYREMK
ncbi:hypothetical protein L3X38_010851 [Prunus dulcis]|uniref:Uncharacterized protein n=1 Tax=Prunus dulcis TaxID=3755 RepID=A0AAD4WGF2_PRUDU|nr:hypothetical protein L3X38_010851 [Prunus dulcis]